VFGEKALHCSEFANTKPFHVIGERVEFLGRMIADGSDRDRASECSHGVSDLARVFSPTCDDTDAKVCDV
jgi:hypothetical protein